MKFSMQSTSKREKDSKLKSGSWIFLTAPRKSEFRKLVFALHKWLGLTAALYIMMMSLSGVSLVFHDEISEYLCPPRHIVPGSQIRSFNQIRDAAEAAFPRHKTTGFISQAKEDLPLSIFATSKVAGSIHLEINPYTCEVLGLKQENEALKFLSQLHFNLLNGSAGRTANGFGAATLLLMALTGLIVWFRGMGNWRSGYRFRLTGKKRTVVWSFHSTLGAWAFPLLLIWGTSGMSFAFPATFEQTLNLVFPVSSQQKDLPIASERNEASERIGKTDFDKLAAAALAAVPESASVKRIALADKKRKSIRVWLIMKNVKKEETLVHIDPASEKVYAIVDPEKVPSGDRILRLLLKLHFGTILGSLSKCIWVFAGLIPGTLAATAIFLFVSGLKQGKNKERVSQESAELD